MTQQIEYETRRAVDARPPALRVVAWLFIAFGILSAIEMVSDLFHKTLTLNFMVLGIFIGRGLLRLRPGWRTCALVFIWIGLVTLPLVCLVAVTIGRPATFTVFGVYRGTISAWLVLLPAAAGFALVLWEYRVLTRPEIRRLFLGPTR